jgi:tripartite ATP-independent transporter DctM subunit
MTIVIFIVALLGAMAIGLPVSFSLLVTGLSLMFYLGFDDPQIVIQNMWEGANSFPLLAVPFFMVAGEFMNAGGMTRRIIDIATIWVGHIKGGLGYVVVFAAIIMASLSGSAVADTAALAAVLIPLMRKAGYNVHRAGGLIAAGGVIAPVLPPSIPLILYGVQGQVSITKLFMAGIVPGIMMGVAILIAWRLCANKEVNVVQQPKASWSVRIKSLRQGVWALALPVIIIGGLRAGYFTPTEAAVIAAAYALFVGMFVYREITYKNVFGMFLNAAKTTAVVMFLVAAASVSAWLITAADIPMMLIEMLEPVMHNQMLLIFTLMILILVISMAMDLTPTVLILTPVLMPILSKAGIDPVYFGILFIMNVSISLLTPPVGSVLNVVCGLGKMRMEKLVQGVWPFLLAELIVLFLLVAFPSLVMVPLGWFS